MTLPASGLISANAINLEQVKVGTTLFSMDATDNRALAQRAGASTAISMSNFHGKAYMTAEMVLTWLAANARSRFYDNVAGGSGATWQTQNGPYERYTTTTGFTAGFSGGTAGLVDSLNTTVVLIATGASPSIYTYNINGGNDPWVVTNPNYIVNNWAENSIYTFNIGTSWKNISSIHMAWSHANANLGTWPAIACIPGKWNFSWQRADLGGGTPVVSPAMSIAFGSNHRIAYNGVLQPLYNFGPGGVYVMVDRWWYNNGGAFMYVNPTTSAHSPLANVPYDDGYGNASNPTYNASILATWVSP